MSSDVIYRRLRYFLSPQLDLYQSIARKVAGQTVLDVGFGTGIGTLQLTRTARSVVGIETDIDMVDFAQKTLPGARWARHDITKPPYGSPFDAIVMVEVLEHIADWQLALGNACSLLRAGGKLYISARNAKADLRRNEIHEREWTATQFSAALGSVFSSVKLYDYTLENELDADTHVTPLIAVATK